MQTGIFPINGNAHAIRIPAGLAYERPGIELEIEDVGEELRIRPVRRPLAGVLEKFARFCPEFIAEGHDGHTTPVKVH